MSVVPQVSSIHTRAASQTEVRHDPPRPRPRLYVIDAPKTYLEAAILIDRGRSREQQWWNLNVDARAATRLEASNLERRRRGTASEQEQGASEQR
jgi:hypothetical protein